MKPSNVCLPKSEIPLLLSGDLSPDEVAAAENHIAECESCRSAIESMIADSRWWDDARHSLAASAMRSADRADVAHDTEPTTNEQMLELLGPTDDPAMLGRIGVYEIVGILGHGGMGVVFKGYDGALNRFVAIKMLLPHLAASGAARKRFAREAQAAAAVVDDHVMAIHGVSEWKSVPYFVMPYARGVSLQKRLSNNGPLEVREILRIGMQAARGLAAAHAQGLVHRDVKPANIFLDEGVERVQLMDFGLARAVDDASLTRSGTLAGTPQYMSPEQARAETVDHLSDLFSLGSVIYAMCVGHAPFRAESSYSVLRLITDKEPRPIREINPEVPEWLCLIIGKLMSKQTSDRFESAEGVAELLADCLAHVQQPSAVALPASLVPRVSGRRSFFNSTRVGVMTMLGTIGMTLLGMVLWQATDAPDISGQWTSDELGAVVLEAKAPGQYEGTFSGSGISKTAPRNDPPRGGHGDGYDSFGGIPKSGSYMGTVDLKSQQKIQAAADSMLPGDNIVDVDLESVLDETKSGTLHLKWSRLERRFNGTWGKGAERSGTMSLRLVDKEIRGGWTTDEEAQLESGTPLVGDLLWKRSVITVPDGGTVLLGGLKITDEAANTPRKVIPGEILVEIYGGRGIYKSLESRNNVGKLLLVLQAVKGVTIDIHEDGKGDAFTKAVVHDPEPVRAEPAENQEREERTRSIKIAIDEALRAHNVPNIRWLDANGKQQEGPAAKGPAQPPTNSANMAEPEFSFGQPQRVLNVSQVLQEGRALNESEEVVVVRFRVANARPGRLKGDKDWEDIWTLSSEPAPYEDHPLAFRVDVATKALDELKKNGIEDIAKHFVGKILEVEGGVHTIEMQWQLSKVLAYGITVNNLEQIREAKDIPPVIDGSKTLDRENIRSVIEVYVAAALRGDHTTAASVAIVQGKSADPKQIEPQIQAISRSLNLKQLAMHSIHVNDCEQPTRALAISKSVTHAEKQRNGERTGIVILELTRIAEEWFVAGVEFRSKEAAEDQLKQFLEANPSSIDLPPLTPNSLPKRNPAEDPSAIVPAIERPLDRKNASAVVEAWVAAVIAKDVTRASALAKGMRFNDKRTKDMATLIRENGIPKLYKSWFEKHSAVVALGPVTSSDEKMNGLFLLFTLSVDDERWSIVDIDLEAEQSLRDRFTVPANAVDEAHDGRAEEHIEVAAEASETAKHLNDDRGPG